MLKRDMHYRALALVNAYDVFPGIRSFVDRMAFELGKLNVELELKNTAEIYAMIGEDGELYGNELPYDFVLFLDSDRYVSHLLEECGMRLFNSARALETCDDKMLAYMNLMHFGIAFPRTVPGPFHYSLLDNETFLNNLPSFIPFPIVAKTNFSIQGESVYLAQNADELREIEAKIAYKPRLYQQFIEASKGFDYRLYIVNGEYVCGYKRRSLSGDFRSNIPQDTMPVEHTMKPYQIEVAEQVAKALKLEFCAVDLLESGDPERPIFCDVNGIVPIEDAEKTTATNIAAAYATYIFNTMYRV